MTGVTIVEAQRLRSGWRRFGWAVFVMLCACAEPDATAGLARIRIETTLSAGQELNELRVQLREPGAATAFYDARWRLGTEALAALPTELVVHQGRATTIEVAAEALLEEFLVDRQEGVVSFAEPVSPTLVLTLGPRFMCGNGRVDAGEECDCGVASTRPATCAGSNDDEAPNRCRRDCQLAHCGDGVIDSGEECDDMNDVEADLCTNACLHNVCGDGVPLPGVLCFSLAPTSAEMLDTDNVGKLFAIEVDGDGRPDLVTIERDLRTRRNLGDGRFAPYVVSDTADLVSHTPMPARLNDDAITDVVFYHGQYGKVTAALGDGAGGIVRYESPAWPSSESQPLSYYWSWGVGRIDGDDLDDLFITHKLAERINVLLADGAGGWRYAPWLELPPTLADVFAVHLADVDEDGDNDALVGFNVAGLVGDVALWWGHGDGTFDYAGVLGLGTGSGGLFRPLVLATVNADSQFLDLVVLTGDSLVLFLGDGLGGFVEHASVLLGQAGSGSSLMTTDFEANGRIDLFVLGSIETVEVAPDATLVHLPKAAVFEGLGRVYRTPVADFDGDGPPDIARPSLACGFECTTPVFDVYLNRP